MSTHVRSQEEIAARVKALESILIEKGIMTTAAVDRLVEIYENEVGPQLGAKVVARSWTDPGFKQRLLADATKARADFGIGGLQGEDMVVAENTADIQNVIVCTLELLRALAHCPGDRPGRQRATVGINAG
jgi:nitrile hydratase